MKRVSILFVCTGNICRSPIAEGIMAHLATEAGIGHDVVVDSAGTDGWHVGDPPDRRSIAVAKRHGVDLSNQRARRVTSEDIDSFDIILGMDRTHVASLRRLAPDARNVFLFGDHALGTGEDIADPYYGSERDFEQVYARLLTGCRKLLAALGADNAS